MHTGLEFSGFKMIPNLDPRAMAMAMKKLGIKQTELTAKEVIIRTEDKNIIIKNPVVTRINMMGQESFQIMGEVQEISNEINFAKEDIDTVMHQANCSEDDARSSLKDTNGDIAEAILKLKEKFTK